MDPASILAQTSGAEQTIEGALEVLQTILEYAGTIAFGISGALAAGRKRMDFVGVVVLGSIVAVGGGTTRDLVLGDAPVFWISNPTFLLVGALAALAVIPLSATRALDVLQGYRLIQLSDAAGMAVFVVTGTNVAFAAGADAIAAAIVGVISGVGGGSSGTCSPTRPQRS